MCVSVTSEVIMKPMVKIAHTHSCGSVDWWGKPSRSPTQQLANPLWWFRKRSGPRLGIYVSAWSGRRVVTPVWVSCVDTRLVQCLHARVFTALCLRLVTPRGPMAVRSYIQRAGDNQEYFHSIHAPHTRVEGGRWHGTFLALGSSCRNAPNVHGQIITTMLQEEGLAH